jgi:hypothetical protein
VVELKERGLKMTPKARVEMALRGEIPDKIPFTVYENKIPQCQAERELRNRGLCIVDRKGGQAYQVQTPNVKTREIHYTENGVSYTKTEISTPAGELSTLISRSENGYVEEKRLFSSPEDYRIIKAYLKDMVYIPTYERALKREAYWGGDAILRAGMGATPLHRIMYGIMDLMTFCMEWEDNRDEIMQLYDILADNNRKCAQILAKSPVHLIDYGGNETPEVIGLERFEKYVIPCHNEVADLMHENGKIIGTHLDGNTQLFKNAIAQCRLDYIEALTPPPDCDMSVKEARQIWKGKKLWINFPSSVHLSSNEIIEEMTMKLINEAYPGDGFIIGITEDVPEFRWRESFNSIMNGIEKSISARNLPINNENFLPKKQPLM